MSLLLVVALALGGVGVYIAYRDPKLGAAILVGLGVITVLYLIWRNDPSLSQTVSPTKSSPNTTQAPYSSGVEERSSPRRGSPPGRRAARHGAQGSRLRADR